MALSPEILGVHDLPRPVAAAATNYPTGHSTDWHHHPKAQLIYGISGVMTVTTQAGVWVIPPGRAVWVPAGIEHKVDIAGVGRMRSLFVAADAARDMPGQCAVVTVPGLLKELILAAVELPKLYDEDGPDGRLMRVILDQLRRLKPTPLYLPNPSDARLKRIADAIAADPADRTPLDEWAKRAGASARTLARLFVKQTGLTFGAWRQQARLLKALEWLAEGRPVTAVALDLGYESPSAFIAMFRRALRVSPGRYFKTPATSRSGPAPHPSRA